MTDQPPARRWATLRKGAYVAVPTSFFSSILTAGLLWFAPNTNARGALGEDPLFVRMQAEMRQMQAERVSDATKAEQLRAIMHQDVLALKDAVDALNKSTNDINGKAAKIEGMLEILVKRPG